MASAVIEDQDRSTPAAGATVAVLDRFFAPHGASAYFRWLGIGGRSGSKAPDAGAVVEVVRPNVVQPNVAKAGVATKVRPASSRPAPRRPRPAADAPVAKGEVDFRLSGLVAVAEGTLLETAEAAGLAPRNRCRRGICGTCTTPKAGGPTFDVRTGETSEGAEPVRLCVSVAQGDVALDL